MLVIPDCFILYSCFTKRHVASDPRRGAFARARFALERRICYCLHSYMASCLRAKLMDNGLGAVNYSVKHMLVDAHGHFAPSPAWIAKPRNSLSTDNNTRGGSCWTGQVLCPASRRHRGGASASLVFSSAFSRRVVFLAGPLGAFQREASLGVGAALHNNDNGNYNNIERLLLQNEGRIDS